MGATITYGPREVPDSRGTAVSLFERRWMRCSPHHTELSTPMLVQELLVGLQRPSLRLRERDVDPLRPELLDDALVDLELRLDRECFQSSEGGGSSSSGGARPSLIKRIPKRRPSPAMGPSNRSPSCPNELFLKREGTKLYKYAVQTVAVAMKECLVRADVPVGCVRTILLHQANGKMDDAIVEAFYEQYGVAEPPAGVQPMTISWLGNSSVATIPTMLHLIA